MQTQRPSRPRTRRPLARIWAFLLCCAFVGTAWGVANHWVPALDHTVEARVLKEPQVRAWAQGVREAGGTVNVRTELLEPRALGCSCTQVSLSERGLQGSREVPYGKWTTCHRPVLAGDANACTAPVKL